MSSCAYIRLRIWFYYQTAISRLESHLEKKEDEQFRRMIREYKKLGYDRRDKPGINEAPEAWNLQSTGDRRAVKQWAVDSRLTSLCGGYKTDYDFDSDLARYYEWTQYQTYSLIQHPAKIFIRPRLEILLHTVLREARQQARIRITWTSKLKPKQDLNRDQHPYQPCTQDPGIDLRNPTGLDRIDFATDRHIFMPFKSNGVKCAFKGKINHVVFSGEKIELDATFVVLRAPNKGRTEVWDLVKIMGMIHHARKASGKKSQIYGLATDSYKFAFAHIDEKSRESYPFQIHLKT
ncbi:hypothetical protein BDW69DRAFT_179503 [Aspergillus filifer]